MKKRMCDACEAEAEWISPMDLKYSKAFCDQCYNELLESYKNFKRI